MSTPEPPRLASVDEYKAYVASQNLGSAAAVAADKVLVEMLLNAATPIVEEIVGPVFDRQIVDEEVITGTRVAVLAVSPVKAIVSVTTWGGSVVTTGWRITDAAAGLVTGVASGSLVSYTAGRGGVVPPEVKVGVLELVAHWVRWRRGGSQTFAPSGGEQGAGAAPGMGFAVPNRVREMLAPQARPPRAG